MTQVNSAYYPSILYLPKTKQKMNFLFQKTGYTQPRAVRTYAFFKYFNFTEKYAPNLLGL